MIEQVEQVRLATRKRHPLLCIIVWCFNKLNPTDKAGLICAMIMFAQEDKVCQKIAYISCAHCPRNIPEGKGMRALGFRERNECNTRESERQAG